MSVGRWQQHYLPCPSRSCPSLERSEIGRASWRCAPAPPAASQTAGGAARAGQCGGRGPSLQAVAAAATVPVAGGGGPTGGAWDSTSASWRRRKLSRSWGQPERAGATAALAAPTDGGGLRGWRACCGLLRATRRTGTGAGRQGSSERSDIMSQGGRLASKFGGPPTTVALLPREMGGRVHDHHRMCAAPPHLTTPCMLLRCLPRAWSSFAARQAHTTRAAGHLQ